MSPESNESGVAAHLSAGRWLSGVGLLSGVINLLGLTGALFMLQVYDRVLTSRSVPTLVGLAIIAAALFAIQGVLEVIRSRVLVRLGSRVDEVFSRRVFAALLRRPLRQATAGDGLQPLRDLDQIRSFASGQGPIAILDLPWLPIYLIFIFFLHSWLGWLALAGAVVLFALALTTELKSRAPGKSVLAQSTARQAIAGTSRRNTEVLHAMGFVDHLAQRFTNVNDRYLTAQERASDVTGGLGAISRVFRITLQSAVIGLGAYLALQNQLSAGAIIAASIVVARALAPIDLAVTHWKGFVAARASAGRLRILLNEIPVVSQHLSLPAPKRDLVVENLSVSAPGGTAPIVNNASFKVEAGQGLGIIGPSAMGKSTLARALVGVWPIVEGSVRLDGATIDQWNLSELGRHIGYLPQDIELFDGTVAENIARFAEKPDAQAVVAAARAANVHEMILKLPDGYETNIGDGGQTLSGGQRQRIALARALYGDPFLVVLDEPNSNLDRDGEAALTRVISAVRERGGIVIVVAHRPSAILAVDLLAVMEDGQLRNFGTREEIVHEVGLRHGALADTSSLSALPRPHENQRTEPAPALGTNAQG